MLPERAVLLSIPRNRPRALLRVSSANSRVACRSLFTLNFPKCQPLPNHDDRPRRSAAGGAGESTDRTTAAATATLLAGGAARWPFRHAIDPPQATTSALRRLSAIGVLACHRSCPRRMRWRQTGHACRPGATDHHRDVRHNVTNDERDTDRKLIVNESPQWLFHSLSELVPGRSRAAVVSA